MKLFDVLALHLPELHPSQCKLHLASPAGADDPLDAFLAGRFEAWQAWQGKRNFERPTIVSLIKLPEHQRWLFAGCYERLGRDRVTDPAPPHWHYRTAELPQTQELVGRLVIHFRRTGRAAYLDAERWAAGLTVHELRSQRMAVADFPGYRAVMIDAAKLRLIVEQRVPSWRAALSSVGGIYLITDTRTGKLYVGSATGEDGLWARWCDYATNGHGGNRDLRRLLKEHGEAYADGFQYSLLEVADPYTSAEEIIGRETHWKNVLRSREFGYNGN
jgi:hypothetical protein